MSQVRYPHRATRGLDALEPLNGPLLHDRIYNDILIAGLDFRRDQVEECPGVKLLGTLMDIHQDYSDEAGPFGDMFGEWLECNGQTSERNGQFFTPIDIVDMIVEMTFQGTDLSRKAPWTINDPACGTGRFMLRTARYFAGNNHGALNFLITNVDIDRRAFTYCTLNAVLNGIPAIHIHGDTLRMEVWDAFATLPIGRFALWERLRPEIARDLIIQSLKPPAEPVKPALPPIPKATVQAPLFPDGEAA